MNIRTLLAIATAALISGAAVAQTPQPTTPARPAPAVTAPAPATPAKPTTTASTTQKVNLNTATAAELDALPQIGEARSKSIIAARGKAKFKNWTDFVARANIPKNAQDAIKDKVQF